MKNRILLIGLGFLWACSGDPKQQGNQDRSPGQSEVHDAADSTRDNKIGDGSESGTQSAANGSGNVIFNGGNDGNGENKTDVNGGGQAKGGTSGAEEQGQVVDGSKTSVVTVPQPSTEPAVGAEEGSVTPPHVVTGAYLVGTLLPSEPGEPIKVGLMVKSEDVRLTLENGFETNWFTTTVIGDASLVRLDKPKDSIYDRILEFDGSLEEFAAMQDAIAMQVSVVQLNTESGLNTVLVKTLGELLVN